MNKLIYFLIFLMAWGLRSVNLDKVPSSLSNDEISIAYDSYSILHTLKDEHGNFLPLSFESHATYKAPLTGYLGVATNYFFGNTEFAARFNSALLGSLTVIIVGLLAAEIIKNKKAGWVAALILALTPWHIYSSRMILESNIALFFLASGIYLFVWQLKSKSWLGLDGAALALGLSVWGYHTEWLLVPMLVTTLFLVFRPNLEKKRWGVFLGVLVLVCLPIFLDYIDKLGTTARANSEMFYKEVHFEAMLKDPSVSTLLKFQSIVKLIVDNYLNYLNFRYIFYSGLSIMNSDYLFLPGLVFVVWMPFLLIGLLEAFKKKSREKNYRLLLWLFFLSPIVPAITLGSGNSVRFIPMLVPMIVLVTLGVIRIYKSKYWPKARIILPIVLGVQLFYFVVNYYVVFPIASAIGYQYGFRQVADYINLHQDEYNKFIIHGNFGPGDIYVGVPHLYVSYFTKADPAVLQQRTEEDNGFLVGKNLFKTIDWSKEVLAPNRLYFVSEWNKPDEVKLGLNKVGEIHYPNGEVFRLIYKKK
jgi:4-amino-4-deoxy-L-arabinose transferase-like glycosyltransferase